MGVTWAVRFCFLRLQSGGIQLVLSWLNLRSPKMSRQEHPICHVTKARTNSLGSRDADSAPKAGTTHRKGRR